MASTPTSEAIAARVQAVPRSNSVKNGAGEIRRVNANVAPLEHEEFLRLKAAGIGTFHVFADTLYLADVHGVVGECPLFEQTLEMTAVESGIEDGCEVSLHLRSFTVADGLDQQIAQRLALELKLAEHIKDLAAERLAGLLQLLQQSTVDIALACLFGYQVPQVANFSLANAVDAPETLLDAVGVPR